MSVALSSPPICGGDLGKMRTTFFCGSSAAVAVAAVPQSERRRLRGGTDKNAIIGNGEMFPPLHTLARERQGGIPIILLQYYTSTSFL